MQKTPFFALFMGLAVLIGAPLKAHSDEFKSTQFGFSLSIPTDMQVVKVESEGVGLALRTVKNQRYPTFNVVVGQPSAMEINSENVPRLADEIVDEYRAVGITDVVLSTAGIESVGAYNALTAALHYTLAGENMCSLVTIVPGASSRYILTYIDLCASQSGATDKFKALKMSFKLLNPPQSKGAEIPSAGGGTAALFAIILAGLFLGALIFYRLFRRQT